MGFLSVLSFAHKLVSERLRPGDTAVDATAGTGADTLFLAKTIGTKGHVHAFDIQEQALMLTRDRLAKESPGALAGITLHHQSHALMKSSIPEHDHGHVGAIMFNLGYLPVDSSDKQIMTETASTLEALEAAIELLRPGGIVTIVLYPGHRGGDAEANAVQAWAAKLPQQSVQTILYRGLQRSEAPYLIALERKKTL
ncbi:class I SAM-dependent methyltransferase [Paenibacillus solani]|uniref:tRNA (mnm(5)s(2)U34)-methyltransferase n=1 Tax=Paenibacillus solani TaxID=1705565 RepID=UPI003D272C74